MLYAIMEGECSSEKAVTPQPQLCAVHSKTPRITHSMELLYWQGSEETYYSKRTLKFTNMTTWSCQMTYLSLLSSPRPVISRKMVPLPTLQNL